MLAECLSRLRFADEIVVVLDRCTDRSAEIARQFADLVIEGAWEIEGERRNLGIQACSGEWILEADADEHIGEELAREIRSAIRTDAYDVFDIRVRNYVGKHYVKHGWGGGSFGKTSYQGLFRKGVKSWGQWRVHPHVSITGRPGPDLTHPVDHFIDRDISDMIRRLNRYTDFRARDLLDEGGPKGPLVGAFRKFLSRFWKVYVVRKAYKERELGLMIAFCSALYPLIAYVKAVEEGLSRREKRA